jgi:hypothetical protein
MKIRIGMTVPLVLEDVTHARLLLPHFVSRNFATPDTKKHEVFIQSKTPIWPLNSSLITSRIGDAYSASGSISDADLLRPGSSVRLDRDDVKDMWSEDPFNPVFLIRQTIEERRPIHLNRIVVVVDTSNGMSDVVWAIQSALKSLPATFDVKLIFADSDGVYENNPLKKVDADGRDEVGAALDHVSYAGGADNAPALLKAWETAAQAPGNNAIVWIHRPQPLLLHSVDELRQRWESRPYGPKLYSVQTTAGVDEIEKQLDGIDEVKSVPRMDQLQTDLESLFVRLIGRATLEFVRSTKPETEVAQMSDAFHTSDHLARLWANDEVGRILAPRDPSLEDKATALAVRYQLVTPVSGAVVLENEAQYRAANLQPVDAGTVPTIPEPEMIALLLIGGAFMIGILYFKYRKSGPGRCTV